jgi:hypothetical protein
MTLRIVGARRFFAATGVLCVRASCVALACALVVAAGCQPPPPEAPPAPPPTTPPPPPPPRPDAAPVDPPPPPPPDAGVTNTDTAAPPDSAPTGDAGSTPDGAGGDATPAVSLFNDPLARPPADLKDVGLYTALPGTAEVNPRAFYFEPRYPLYSNGLDKARYAVLPEGTKIDTTVRDSWDFPVGTLLFKTFSFKDPTRGGASKPVETRLIRRVKAEGPIEEQWEFHVWEWNADATAATLLSGMRRTPREVNVGGQTITHNIPRRTDCWTCHIANKSPIIGFDELRLNHTISGAAQTQLAQVVARQWLTRAPTAPFASVPNGRNPLEKQVLEYATANCVHCHNGVAEPREPGQRYAALDLTPGNLVRDTVSRPTMSTGTASGTRVIPGDPMRSILLLAIKAVDDPMANMEVKPMPLVGVDKADPVAIDLFQRWIMALPR